jgi:hypothetical protein
VRGSKNAAATCLLLLIFVVLGAATSIAEEDSWKCGAGSITGRCHKPPTYDLTSCPDDLSDRPEVDEAQRCGKHDIRSCFYDKTCSDCTNGVFRENAAIQKYNSFMRACRNDYIQRRLDQMPREPQKPPEPEAKIMRIDRKD